MQSMTGFASATGNLDRVEWVWEVRGVNARGLDLRLRLPDGSDALDSPIRKTLQAAIKRGAVTIGLRVNRSDAGLAASLDAESFKPLFSKFRELEMAALDVGLTIAPSSVAQILGLRGLNEAREDIMSDEVIKAVGAQIKGLVRDFVAAREQEGKAIRDILSAQIDETNTLVRAARETAEARASGAGDRLREKVATLMDAQQIVDEARLAQELAQIAVKADVTEELDRLDAHVVAARDLLVQSGPVGRKLDFLMQEFNREANTLCSKSGSTDLTGIGLDLKVLIDQMREQVQNVE